MPRIQKGLAHPFERVEREKRREKSGWTEGTRAHAYERGRKKPERRGRERSKEEASERRIVRQGRNVRPAREVSTCVFHSFAIFWVRSSVFLVRSRSSARLFLRRRVGYSRVTPVPRSSDTVTLPPRARKLDPTARLFCKVLFFRNAGPTIVFPRRAPAPPSFPSIWPRYIGTPPPPSFSASDSVHPPRQARLESVLRREFTRSRDTRCRGALYRAGQPTPKIARRRGYLLKEVSASSERYPKLVAAGSQPEVGSS